MMGKITAAHFREKPRDPGQIDRRPATCSRPVLLLTLRRCHRSRCNSSPQPLPERAPAAGPTPREGSRPARQQTPRYPRPHADRRPGRLAFTCPLWRLPSGAHGLDQQPGRAVRTHADALCDRAAAPVCPRTVQAAADRPEAAEPAPRAAGVIAGRCGAGGYADGASVKTGSRANGRC
jgi:hypothetical protein